LLQQAVKNEGDYELPKLELAGIQPSVENALGIFEVQDSSSQDEIGE
jgi:hypothetical protein